MKNKLNSKFDYNDNYQKIMEKIVKKQYQKKFVFRLATLLCIFTTGLMIVNAKEISEVINKVKYKYESQETWQNKEHYGVSKDSTGVHSIAIGGTVSIKDVDENTLINSVSDFEKKVGVKLLQLSELKPNYIDVKSLDANRVNYLGFYKNPSHIVFKISNYYNFACYNPLDFQAEPQNVSECLNESAKSNQDKRLKMSITFLTQYASEQEINDFVLYIADFPQEETEIINFDELNTKIYITRWNEYIFVYDNIVYIIDNSKNDYPKDELLTIIKKMTY